MPRDHYLGCDGPLPFAPGASPFHLKGEFYRNIAESIAFIEQRSGGKMMQALDAAGLREFASQKFLAGTFYDFLPMPRIVMAMAQVQGRELSSYSKRMGELGAQAQLTGVYKTILGTMNTRTFATRFDQILCYFYDCLKVSITPKPEGATLICRRIPYCAAEWWSLVSTPYVSVPLIHNGAKNLTITEHVQAVEARREGVQLGEVRWEITWE